MHYICKRSFLLVLFTGLALHAGIREYSPADMPIVCEIMRSNWAKLSTEPAYNQAIMNGMLISRAPFDPAHKDKKLYVLVYEIDNQVVGFATYYYADAKTGHVELLAVTPAYQSKGLGKQMMEYIQNECVRNNAKAVQLYVYPSNPKAIDFYKRLGFNVKLRALQHWLLSKMLA